MYDFGQESKEIIDILLLFRLATLIQNQLIYINAEHLRNF